MNPPDGQGLHQPVNYTRFLTAYCNNNDAMPSPLTQTADLFGVRLNAVTFEDAVELLARQVPRRPAKVVVTPNVDHFVSLSENTALRETYASADFAFADGMPVVWAGNFLGKPVPERVTGADLFVAFCLLAQENGWRVNVLGGMPGQEQMLLERFSVVYPELQVEILSPGMGFSSQSDEAHAAAAWVNKTKPDIVFVCLGFPRQCLWSLGNRPTLNTGLVFCVGAAMEFALGIKSRAPLWMQRRGLEWLWRLGSEPTKLWRRYLVRAPRFLLLVMHAWREQKRVR
jgi:N-acetylglucosaminyldiphosphoundecaprenol N-acetyl-beta-D-mannosaminyltransferase